MKSDAAMHVLVPSCKMSHSVIGGRGGMHVLAVCRMSCWPSKVRDLSGMTSVVFVNSTLTWVLFTTRFHRNVQWLLFWGAQCL